MNAISVRRLRDVPADILFVPAWRINASSA